MSVQPLSALTLLFTIVLASAAAHGQPATEASPAAQVIRIGTMHSPPFIVKDAEGGWNGVSIDLWRRIANDLDIDYQFEERDIQGLLDGVQDGSLDAAMAALTITEGREKLMDFTHPFYITGLAVAIQREERTGVWWEVLSNLFSWRFVQIVGFLVSVLLLVGWIVWLVEHKQEIAHGDSHTIRHIGEGFWWAAATMTTVGYGDKTPLTMFGRLLGVVWMFTALMLVASFIAAFSSALTVERLESRWKGPQDLQRVVVATVPASTAEQWLIEQGIAAQVYPDTQAGLRALAEGEVDAMVYDAPLIRYLVQTRFPRRLEVLPFTFERQDYGFALSPGSELREPINQSLIRIIREPAWNSSLDRYLGQ